MVEAERVRVAASAVEPELETAAVVTAALEGLVAPPVVAAGSPSVVAPHSL